MGVPQEGPSELERLPIAGVIPFTSIDYPGLLSTVAFLQGCPWRCSYCHNPHLQHYDPPQDGSWNWNSFLAFLERRVGWLDAVVFSGGEPTSHSALIAAAQMVRALGYKVGLHTAGMFPTRFEKVLPELDWVGFDVKAPLDDRYDRITGVSGSAPRVLESLRHLLKSGVKYQIRTTVHPWLLCQGDLADINSALKLLGATETLVQEFRTEGTVPERLPPLGTPPCLELRLRNR